MRRPIRSRRSCPNGKTYNKANGMPTAISLDYNSPTLSYTIVYEAEAQAPSSPYSVRIIYKDAASRAVIGSSSMVIPVNGTGSFNIPSTITTPDHVDYILATGQPAQIQHAANNSTRTYEVYYNVSSVKNPYTVSISLVDIATGAVIGSETLDVAVGVRLITKFLPLYSLAMTNIIWHQDSPTQ